MSSPGLPSERQNSSFHRKSGIRLSWDNLGYQVLIDDPDNKGQKIWKPLVQRVTGSAIPGRVMAIMGPSGAGKTTFLNAVSGRMGTTSSAKVDGVVFINNVVYSEKYRPLAAFVTQDDICMGKNTPWETIYMSRRLARGSDAEEAALLTDAMIARLSLGDCKDTLIGVPGLIKGISGGEKKRTNIGCELVNDPDIVFLDEPTTGLDSVNALRVGTLLKDIAENDNRTVICTIHTPSSELFALFDDILLMAKGRIVYHGPTADAPAYFASVGHPLPLRVNPSEFYMELLQADDATLDRLISAFEARYPPTHSSPHEPTATAPAAATSEDQELSAKAEAYIAKSEQQNKNQSQILPAANSIVLADPEGFDKLVAARGASLGAELAVLTSRSWKLTMRDPGGTFGRLVQVLFFALFCGLLFIRLGTGNSGVQDRQGGIFFFSINMVFANMMPALASFPPERAVFLNEMTKSLYHPVSYYLAKTIAEFPLHVFMNTVYLVITYWLMGLAPTAEAFFIAYGIGMIFSYCSNAFGVFAASLFPKMEVAMAFVPIAILPMMLVGGLFANTARLDPYWLWLNSLSFMRFGFKAFINNEFEHVDNSSICEKGQVCRFQTGTEVIKFMGFDSESDSVRMSVLALSMYMIGLRIIGALGLFIQAKGRQASMAFIDNWKQRSAN